MTFPRSGLFFNSVGADALALIRDAAVLADLRLYRDVLHFTLATEFDHGIDRRQALDEIASIDTAMRRIEARA